MIFGLPWNFHCRNKLKQQSFRFKPRNSGGQGQLRTDAEGGRGRRLTLRSLQQRIVAMGGKTIDSPGGALQKVSSYFLWSQNQVPEAKEAIFPKIESFSRMIRDRDKEIEISNDISETITAKIKKNIDQYL